MFQLGDKIRMARIGAGLSQSALATVLEITRKTVYNYETNITIPDVITLLKISILTGRNITYFYDNLLYEE